MELNYLNNFERGHPWTVSEMFGGNSSSGLGGDVF